MIRKNCPQSLPPTYSSRAAAVLLAASLGMTVAAQAGDEDARPASNRDFKNKNVIQQPPPAEPKFYVDIVGRR